LVAVTLDRPVLAALAETERDLLVDRTQAGLVGRTKRETQKSRR
jgi:hypothetical protein